jgi:lipopolysaccharide/colanic/teichoic acid biosynthesis glycosyltransferase
MSPWLHVRTLLDRAVAALLLVPVLPLLAVLTWRIRRAGPGPGIVRVPRVGRDGCEFEMWKLRTMSAGRADGRALGSSITAAGDERITPLGRRLRALRLDELPQLLHVVSGRMALIGPRPEDPGLVTSGDPIWRAVLRARPGIAGPTQLLVADWEAEVLRGTDPVGRYRATVLPVKLAVDTWYVEHATPWTDVLVVVSLVQRIVLHRRSTVIDRHVRRAVPATAAIDRARLESVAA